MSEPPRSVYRLDSVATAQLTLPDGLRLRTVTDADDAALAQLMERAYAGTIDELLGGNSDGAVPSERVLRKVGFERVGPV